MAIDPDVSSIWLEQPHNQLEDDGFSGAAGAHQNRHMGGRDVEADVTQHDMVIERQRDSIEVDRKRLAEGFLRISAVVFKANIDARAARCPRRCSAPAL